jgi:hypothetical protein
MTNVAQFPDAQTRQQKVREDFNADFKKRWLAKGDCGEFTNDIWAWQEMLEQSGWVVQLYDNSMQESATFVNFDKKLITNRNVKAYHAQKALSLIIDHMFEGKTGRWLYYWEEVHDEAHRHVRDGDEWKDDPEYYMSVWYSMELYVREVQDGEDIPLAPVVEYTEPMIGEGVDPRAPLEPL